MSNATSTPPKHLADLHFEHLTWTRQFDFYKSELHYFQKRLEEIALRNTDKDILSEVEPVSYTHLTLPTSDLV